MKQSRVGASRYWRFILTGAVFIPLLAAALIITHRSSQRETRQDNLDRALNAAVYYGNASEIKKLIALGADVNRRGGSPAPASIRDLLMRLTRRSEPYVLNRLPLFKALDIQGQYDPVDTNVDIVSLLLDHGAKPNLRDRDTTPLLHACENAQETNARLLLEHGADPNMKNSLGYTPLLIAASGNEPVAIKALLAHGAKVNATTETGETALMISCCLRSERAVKLLLAAHATVNNRSVTGDTALSLAMNKDATSIIRLLKGAGAK